MQNDCIYCAGSARVQIKCRNYFNFLRSSRSVFLAPMLRFSLPGDILAPEVYFLTVKEQFFLGTFWHFVSIIITQVQNPYIVHCTVCKYFVKKIFIINRCWHWVPVEHCLGQRWAVSWTALSGTALSSVLDSTGTPTPFCLWIISWPLKPNGDLGYPILLFTADSATFKEKSVLYIHTYFRIWKNILHF